MRLVQPTQINYLSISKTVSFDRPIINRESYEIKQGFCIHIALKFKFKFNHVLVVYILYSKLVLRLNILYLWHRFAEFCNSIASQDSNDMIWIFILYLVLDLWENQKRFSNAFFYLFWQFFRGGGSIKTWGLRGTRGGGGVHLPPPTNWALSIFYSIYSII